MKKDRFKGSFLFIVGISIIVIILFVVGFATFYKDSSLVFSGNGYIINSTENSSNSYSFASGTKYKTNLSNDIAFSDTDNNSVSVDSASFVHYDDGSISFLQNGALLDLDEIDKDYIPYYNISNKFIISYDEGIYSVTSDSRSLTLNNWIGRISDNKYIVVGDDIRLKVPGVSKDIVGDYFELLFMTDGVVKIDNQDVSYQVTCQGSYIYIGDNIEINLGENKIFYDGTAKLSLDQITISGDENIDLDSDDDTLDDLDGSAGNGSSDITGDTATDNDNDTSSTDGDTSTDNNGDSSSDNGTKTSVSTTIELIKLSTTATSMDASLQINHSNLISGSIIAYLTNIGTGERESVSISKNDGTIAICSSGTNCYSFGISLVPDSQYLLSIVDDSNNKQYFQKLITTSELGVSLIKQYTTSSSLSYEVQFNTNSSVSQVDLYLYDESGNEVGRKTGITANDTLTTFTFSGLKSYSSYKAVMKNVSVCDSKENCVFNEDYEVTRNDMTLKLAPEITGLNVKKNVDSASFDLSANIVDEYNTITKYIYTICTSVSLDDTSSECFTKEKTDSDALNIKIGDEISSGVSYVYTFKVQYNDGQMDREAIYNGSSLFSMDSTPYFQFEKSEITSNSISGKLILMDPSCTVPIRGRVCSNVNRNADNNFTLRVYKLIDGEENKKDYEMLRSSFEYDETDGNWYYNLNLSNLASDTKYVLKVYGNYFFNDEERNNVQIGNEIYIDTASTGNLKFSYSSNDSNDTNVINYNAWLSGGSSSEDEEDSLSALNSIETLTFNLYAGSYADDSKTNNRNIGSFSMKGNENIRKNFCSSDVTSDTCSKDVVYNFVNSTFGISNLSELMKKTGEKICNSKDCLSTTYTVVVNGYDSAGNIINIDNNTYVYSVTPSYYVDVQLDNYANKNSIVVDYIKKEQFKNNDNYDFSSIIDNVSSELEDKSTFVSQLNKISDSTSVGILVHASIPQAYINAAYSYDKAVTNYYICNWDDEKCDSENNIKSASVSFSQGGYADSEYLFYLNDSDFIRGKTYKVMYELVFTNSAGVESVYSNEKYTSLKVDIERQAPTYEFSIYESDANSITYRYKITDVDKALDSDDYYFYYSVLDGEVTKGEKFELGTESKVKFTLCDKSCNNVSYNIYLNEKLLKNKEYVSIENTVFDGYYAASDSDNFELVNYNNDNRLYIILNDDELSDRTVFYNVKLSSSGSEIFNKSYLASKLSVCDSDNTSIICENNSDIRYIAVDYADVINYLGKDITVSVDSYYDSGYIGTNQKFNNGLILQNMTLSDDSLTRTCLNVYYSSGRDSSSSCDVIYKVSGSWTFDSVSLYNILDLKSSKDYSNKTGIGFYNGSVDSVSRVYSISYLQNGIKLGDYEKFYPKVVSISNIKSEDSNFRFNHIIPKVKVEENLGINSIGLDFSFTGVNAESLSKQFNSEDGKYYLYVNLYNSDKKLIKENIKVLIDLDNGTSVTIKDLDVDSVYYYKVYADMLEDGKIQVFDGVYENDYVNTFYKTSTADASTLLSKVVFKASAKDYVTSDDKNTISSKEISYNVNVTNGYMMKVRLELYDNTGSQVNFDGSVCNDNNCYKEIIGDSISDLPITDIYNTSDFVFGDGYYTLKVYAIPYYSDSGYDENSKLTLFDQPLSTTSTDTLDIDVHKLDVPTFNADLKSGVSDDDYYVTLSVIGVTDNDKVMKNGEYIINLYDENGNKIRVVKNSGDKVILTDGNGNVVNDNFIDGSLYVSNKIDVKFTGLDNNKRYTVELSYDTYRNNVNYTDSEKETASPYTNSIYTPISSGITLGEGYASKVSDTSFKLSYVGSHSINEIKKVSYKINLRGSSLVTSGEISGDTLFSCSDDEDVCSLLIDLNDSTFGNGFTLKEKGTYNVSIGFYDADGKNIANNFTYVIFV